MASYNSVLTFSSSSRPICTRQVKHPWRVVGSWSKRTSETATLALTSAISSANFRFTLSYENS
ncbi:unnamed protein product, partial [Nesidiocoris tenuis]